MNIQNVETFVGVFSSLGGNLTNASGRQIVHGGAATAPPPATAIVHLYPHRRLQLLLLTSAGQITVVG